jgi:DNA-binding IclR family transcriptional regulator
MIMARRATLEARILHHIAVAFIAIEAKEIAIRLSAHPNTVYRLLIKLQRAGLITRDARGKPWRIASQRVHA